jgi:hypothetical protein
MVANGQIPAATRADVYDEHVIEQRRLPRPVAGSRPGPRHPDKGQTMTKIEIELPEATAKAAGDAGLLTPRALDRLLTDAIRRRQAADRLLAVADRVAQAGIDPVPMAEIDAEVKAVRAERRRRAGGH